MRYNIFGSGDSKDWDISILADYIGTKEECKKLLLELEKEIANTYFDEPVNCNLIKVEDGIVVASHKGTPDEVNNAMLRTYSLHKQQHECFVNKMVVRNIELKIIRAFRTILSFCSRTSHRAEIKHALRSTFLYQFIAVSNIEFLYIFHNGLGDTKNVTMEHFLKKSAFQIVQVLGLITDNFEYYTKKEIIQAYPKLYPFMYETTVDLNSIYYLDNLRHLMVTTVKHFYLDSMKDMKEVYGNGNILL